MQPQNTCGQELRLGFLPALVCAVKLRALHVPHLAIWVHCPSPPSSLGLHTSVHGPIEAPILRGDLRAQAGGAQRRLAAKAPVQRCRLLGLTQQHLRRGHTRVRLSPGYGGHGGRGPSPHLTLHSPSFQQQLRPGSEASGAGPRAAPSFRYTRRRPGTGRASDERGPDGRGGAYEGPAPRGGALNQRNRANGRRNLRVESWAFWRRGAVGVRGVRADVWREPVLGGIGGADGELKAARSESEL